LEHFTEEGITAFLQESSRITKYGSFHMVPVSRSGLNEGWMRTYQSFYNNSSDWWEAKFKASYSKVIILKSLWEDDYSVGKWFICSKDMHN
jgi:hypothetical protein